MPGSEGGGASPGAKGAASPAPGNPPPPRNGTGKWWQSGRRPDYRFSLANERTFLAWIRTAIALIAGAVGIEQFASRLGTPAIRTGLALGLLAAGGLLAATAYRRWASIESAMRHDTELPRSGLMPALAVVITVLAIVLVAILVG